LGTKIFRAIGTCNVDSGYGEAMNYIVLMLQPIE
jgi:hypothetical protein